NDEPGCSLHQARGYFHALGGVNQGEFAIKLARIRAARTIKVSGGLFDQRHAFLEQTVEHLRSGELHDPALPVFLGACGRVNSLAHQSLEIHPSGEAVSLGDLAQALAGGVLVSAWYHASPLPGFRFTAAMEAYEFLTT